MSFVGRGARPGTDRIRAPSPLTAAYPQIASMPADAGDGRVGPTADLRARIFTR